MKTVSTSVQVRLTKPIWASIGTAGKEVGHDTRNDQIAGKGGNEHADDGSDGGKDESQDDGIGCIGKQNGAIQSGLGVGNEPHRDTLEGRHDVIQQLTNTHHQDVETNDEGTALQE